MDRLHRLHQLQPPLRMGARKPTLACFPAARAEQTHRSASTHWWSCVIANSPTCVFTVCHRFLAESGFFFFLRFLRLLMSSVASLTTEDALAATPPRDVLSEVALPAVSGLSHTSQHLAAARLGVVVAVCHQVRRRRRR